MILRFHRLVQIDINQAQRYYDKIDESLGDALWDELEACFKQIETHPKKFHFDPSGWRRCNLNRFPYHILFQVLSDRIKVMAVRHDRRHPGYGTRRK